MWELRAGVCTWQWATDENQLQVCREWRKVEGSAQVEAAACLPGPAAAAARCDLSRAARSLPPKPTGLDRHARPALARRQQQQVVRHWVAAAGARSSGGRHQLHAAGGRDGRASNPYSCPISTLQDTPQKARQGTGTSWDESKSAHLPKAAAKACDMAALAHEQAWPRRHCQIGAGCWSCPSLAIGWSCPSLLASGAYCSPGPSCW